MSDGTAVKILIVEDQRLIAADLETTLQRFGYEVAGNVSSGEAAIERAADAAPDLVLMDIRLHGAMDGIEAARRIRDRFGAPVVFLTAYADEETIVRAKTATPFGYLVKPFNERELRAAVEIALYTHGMDRQLTEERVRREVAEEFKALVEAVEGYAIIMLDPEGRVVTWNVGAERIKGYRAEEIIGRSSAVFYTEEARQAHHPQLELECARREGRCEEEGWRVRKDGSAFWASVVLSPVFDANGGLRGFAKVTRDLTERKRVEEQRERLVGELREALRVRDEFIQIASHELKTPLTPLLLQIGGLTRDIEKSEAPVAHLLGKVESIKRQTERLNRLVDSLLDVARITGGRLDLRIERFDLVEAARDVTERFEREASASRTPLRLHASGPIVGRWDRLRIEQIVSNLVANAIKYGAGQPVDVEVTENEGTVRIVVTDHGIGIDEESLGRIFERFERAVPSRSYGGLGLGLFIARQIAQAHGGSIVARSRVGMGSTFTVALPLVYVEQDQQPGAPGQRP